MTENQNLTFFYKYRPLIDDTKSNGINENTLKLLENGELFFSDPSNFNDPFDCRIEYDKNISVEDIEKICIRLNVPDFIKNPILNYFSQKPQEAIALLSKQRQNQLLKIFCLSKDEKNILMWSHYAKNHTGICIGLKTYFLGNAFNIKIKSGFLTKSPSFHPDFPESKNILTLMCVNYTDTIPIKYNIGDQNEVALEQSIITKALDWEYEKEYRLILWNTIIIKNPICIEKTEIGEIIFGLKTPENIKEKIIDIIKKYPDPKPNVYQCVYTEGKYAIGKEKIKI